MLVLVLGLGLGLGLVLVLVLGLVLVLVLVLVSAQPTVEVQEPLLLFTLQGSWPDNNIGWYTSHKKCFRAN